MGKIYFGYCIYIILNAYVVVVFVVVVVDVVVVVVVVVVFVVIIVVFVVAPCCYSVRKNLQLQSMIS